MFYLLLSFELAIHRIRKLLESICALKNRVFGVFRGPFKAGPQKMDFEVENQLFKNFSQMLSGCVAVSKNTFWVSGNASGSIWDLLKVPG